MEGVSLLSVRDLAYRYPDGHEALRGLTFTLAPGERVALIGPNGAGKSTLLLHLNGLLPDRPAAEPAITVDGLPLVAANLPEVRRRVGLLFQDPDDLLFCPTVWEDVAFGPQQLGIREPRQSELVRESLVQVGLAGFEDRLPHHLSRGEKRRVCLAGLLACDARLLVLDEPTSGLDPRGRRELMGLLTRLPVGQLIATHDLEFVVEICPRAIVLDGGRIVADGPARKLLDDERLMLAHGLERPHILRHRHPH
ncbi:MAG: energy-coupling factor ABC transporter ATP-binding protein [Gammaproteobacteria bacterium]|nr:energy-coupling factor ABC transporter ATP-binding protein [Gammaproteobacteria bacterium]